jgi:hypothetical protein
VVVEICKKKKIYIYLVRVYHYVVQTFCISPSIIRVVAVCSDFWLVTNKADVAENTSHVLYVKCEWSTSVEVV